MKEITCSKDQVIELKYDQFSYEASVFLVAFAEFADSPSNQTAQFGAIEFEYWAENIQSYSDKVKKGFLVFLVGGVIVCALIIFLFR